MEIHESKFEVKCSNKILALPTFDINNSSLYSTDAINCIKFLRGKVDIDFYVTPDGYWEQRSVDWLGPTLFITGKLLYENPDLLNVLFDLLASYIKEKTPSRDKTTAKIKVVCKKDEFSKTLEIDYEGDIKGFSEIKDAIALVLKD